MGETPASAGLAVLADVDLPDWMSQAACLTADPDLWFRTGSAAQHAKAICRRCPVRQACLEHALERGETEGVWGGLDEEERETIFRLARRARRAHRRAS